MNTTSMVLIVGAGPTGLAAAMELSRFGIAVRLVEKAGHPATTSRAIGVQARTLELLEQRGSGEYLLEHGNQGIAVSAWGGGKRIFRLEFKDVDSKYKYILFVSQAETEKTLRDAIERAGVTIEWSTTMVGFSQAEHTDDMTAVLQHRDGALERVHCAYLISAEGAHSIARDTLGLQFEGKALSEQYALGDFYVDGDLPNSDLHVFSSEYGFLGMFPMGNNHFRMIASNPISKPSKDTSPSMEELQQLYDQRSPTPVKFRDLSWSSWFHINSRMIHRLHVGRIFLGGDSAHIHSPAGGQGMNTGIQDMINLCWKVAMVLKGQAKPELLETYTSERVPVIKDVLTQTEGLTRAIGEENAVFRSVFNHLAPWFVGTDFVQHNSTERLSQLSLNYHSSPLSENHGGTGSLRAGDRVPDLPVTVLNVDGSSDQHPQPGTLFGLLDPSSFTILYSNITQPANPHADIREAIGALHSFIRGHKIAGLEGHSERFDELFGKSSSILLVRPDGYVAFVGSEKSIPQLMRYCDKWLVPEPQPAYQEVQHV